MLTVLSPAKSLNQEPQKQTSKFSTPEFLDEAETLVKKLRRMSKKSLRELMGISEDLAELNHERFNQWARPFSTENAKQAALMFNGDVYQGLQAEQFKARDLAFAQDHLRILSGLYGSPPAAGIPCMTSGGKKSHVPSIKNWKHTNIRN